MFFFFACIEEVDFLIQAKQIDIEMYQNKYRPVKKQNKDSGASCKLRYLGFE
jgi:hypothetical protein